MNCSIPSTVSPGAFPFYWTTLSDQFRLFAGMFQMNEESRLFWFCPNPGADCDRLAEFRLAGLLLGLAVYNSVILDLHLPLALYKLLMGVDVSLQDLKQLDPVSDTQKSWVNWNILTGRSHSDPWKRSRTASNVWGWCRDRIRSNFPNRLWNIWWYIYGRVKTDGVFYPFDKW